MGPRLPLLVAALASCLLPALGCILCDKKVLQELESLEKEYLPTHLRADHHRRLMARVNFALKDFTNLPINEDSYLGVIDEPTLEKASWSLLKELRRIKDSNVKGELFVKELFWMLKQQKDVFARFMALFLKENFCPNKCGTMVQTMIWCPNCKKELHPCRKGSECPSRKVNVHETEDMILDCELNWHKASAALTDYSFYRVWDNKTQTLEYKGKGPTLVKTMVEPKDEGVYLCKLETTIGVTATIIRFHVKVLPKKTVEEKSSDMDDDTGLDDTTWYPIQPTSQPMTSAPTVENMLKSLLVGLLIWGFVVLMASIVIVIFCYWSEKNPGYFIDSLKSWYHTAKEAAKRIAMGAAKGAAKGAAEGAAKEAAQEAAEGAAKEPTKAPAKEADHRPQVPEEKTKKPRHQ